MVLYWATIVMGIYMLVDIFIIEIPGFPVKRAEK